MSIRAGFVAMTLAALVVTAMASQDLRLRPAYEADLGELPQTAGVNMDEPVAVLAFVLSGLPPRAYIMPTENYYYFRFIRDGRGYVGNLRLAVSDRDQGKLHFAYSARPSKRRPDPRLRYAVLSEREGVSVERLAPLQYRVTFRGMSVVFTLNDLSQIVPSAGIVQRDEQFLGTVFDESGLRFFLLFNARLKVFHFVLDESAPVPDQLIPKNGKSKILIGQHTGFAFYADENRKILIGVSARESRRNSHLDGPFDQIPENFIAGEVLLDAIVASAPRVAGRIDRLGHFLDGSGRFLIHPYMLYRRVDDLAIFERCVASRNVPRSERPRCFVISDDQAQRRRPRPLALSRR